MRSITSKKEEAKKKRRNQFIVGGILILLMFLSVVGYGFQGKDNIENENQIEHNGYKFENINGFWRTQIGAYNFAFKNNPKQVERIETSIDPISKYSNQPLYISSMDQEAEYEIYLNLDKFVLRRQYACLANETCENEDFPLKTCEDNFILIKESENFNIVQEENCVYIFAPKANLTQVTDEFLFKALGIV